MNTATFPIQLSPDMICSRRERILRILLETYPSLRVQPPAPLTQPMLDTMLALYDAHFLTGFLAQQTIAEVRILPSLRMTRSAGTCNILRAGRGTARVEIRMGVDFYYRMAEGPFVVDGLTCDTPLAAFLCVLEHELCHVLDFLLYKKPEGHGPRFHALVSGLFGHIKHTHDLPTRAQAAAEQGVGVGQWVRFAYQDGELMGRVTRVGKTATVMVQDDAGAWCDNAGQRYSKYRVTPGHLHPYKRMTGGKDCML